MTKDSHDTTLCANGNWHFYFKKEDRKYVYMSFYLSHNDVPAGRNISFDAPVEIKIPIDVWRSMVLSWQDSDWGKNPNMDNSTMVARNLVREILLSKKEEDK